MINIKNLLILSLLFLVHSISWAQNQGYSSSLNDGYSSSANNAQSLENGYYSSQSTAQPTPPPPPPINNGYSSSINNTQYGTYQNNASHSYVSYSANFGHHHRRLGPVWIDIANRMTLFEDLIQAGAENGNISYLCRAQFAGRMHPGKVFMDSCHIGWQGREISIRPYQILVSHRSLGWVSGSFGYVPHNAYEIGLSKNEPLYVCQASFKNALIPGEIIGQMCHFAWNGKQYAQPHYKVLVRYLHA